MTRAERVTMIARDRADLSVRRQCALLGFGALRGLSRAGGAGCRRAGADAVDRRAVSGDAVLRLTADDGGAAPSGPSGQPQAGATANAADGARSAGPKAQDQPALGAASDLPLS